MSGLVLSASQIQQGSIAVVALVAYAGGLVTAFTPCVYPLIPVTLGIMGAQNARSVGRAFSLSLAFVMGLAVVYSILGLAAASTGKLLGAAAQNAWFTWGVALLFLAMGLSLLGAFEFRLPHPLMHALARHGHAGFVGAFVLGSVSGGLAAPCSGPVVVGILGYVAQKSNPWFGFFLLCVFSLGLGTPFLLLGTFSSLRGKLPSTGVWTEWVKHAAGLAMVLAFFLYVRKELPASVWFTLLGISVLLLALFVRSVFPPPAVQKTRVYGLLRAGGIIAAGLLFWSAWSP
ncbi:MAG: cytochrome c biogenesis protein CcdA, partial [Pseudomonadota bacterium]